MKIQRDPNYILDSRRCGYDERTNPMTDKSKRLKALFETPDILILPGVFDGYSVRLMEQMGFAAASVSGAGASGLIIEDQVWPKRCGHMAGKAVIPAAEMVQKVKAAVDARRDDDFIIRARTDAAGPLGIDEAIDRLNLYAEAGADILFADALLTAGDEPIDRPDLLVSFDELNALTGFDELDRMDEKYSVAETVGHAAG